MQRLVKGDMSSLYDLDFCLWTEAAARGLREGRLAELDLDHLAEEIEDLGNRNAREVRSRITQILEHLLKLKLARGVILEYNRGGWRASIVRERQELDALFEESPSLRRLVGPELLEACYQRAAERIAAEYRVETPARCPFSEQEVLVELVS